MNKLLASALFAAAATTVACSSIDQKSRAANPAPCPNVLVLNDAARLLEFDGDEVLENIAYTAEITDVNVGCRYFGGEPIDADVTIDLAFGKGPKGEEGKKYFKYFVAVTRKDLEVITKKEFVVAADFKGDKQLVFAEEEIDKIIIPRVNDDISGVNFEIIIGMSLTTKQAIFNRSGKSLKFPDLK